MTTDLQTPLTGLPNQGTNSASALRDRYEGFSRSSSSDRFNTVLERAEASRAGSGQNASIDRQAPTGRVRGKIASSSVTVADKETRSPRVENRHEQSLMQGHSANRKEPVNASDSERDKDDSDILRGESDEGSTVQAEQLLAAVVSPVMASEAVAAKPIAASDQSSPSERAVEEVLTQHPSHLSATPSTGDAPFQAASTATISPSQGQIAGKAFKTDLAEAQGAPLNTPDVRGAAAGTVDASLLAQLQNLDETDELTMSLPQMAPGSAKGSEGSKADAVPLHAGETKTLPAVADRNDPAPALDAALRPDSFSERQGAWTSERFLNQDRQQSADASGGEAPSKPHTPSMEDGTNRPFTLDRVSGMGQTVPASNDGVQGRSDAGTVTVQRAAESERMTELRGAPSFTQSVTVDLDPLDMGPLRIRIMMADQTVHAHIRTEHGDLGQGLLQQGPSLESSLRTTGLEMGMLRVTVDQQQGRGENAWLFQQQQGRPTSDTGRSSGTGEADGTVGTRNGPRNDGQVSIFA